MKWLDDFYLYEQTFNGGDWIEWTREHAEIPVFAVSVYLGFVFYVPALLENHKGFTLKWPFACWNIFLAIFSVIGSTRTVPHLYSVVQKHGVDFTVCEDPKDWYLRGKSGQRCRLNAPLQLDPALKALGFNSLKANHFQRRWFQIDSTCTPPTSRAGGTLGGALHLFEDPGAAGRDAQPALVIGRQGLTTIPLLLYT